MAISANGIDLIIDFEKQQFTMLMPRSKLASTLPVSDLGQIVALAMPQSPSTAPLPKPRFEMHATGFRDVIQGVHTEERQIDVARELTPANLLPAGSRELIFRLLVCAASEGEAARNPAIRELSSFWGGESASIARAVLGQFHYASPELSKALAEPPVILRVHTQVLAPALVLALKATAQRTGQTPPRLDPDTPLFETDRIVTQLSDATIDPSYFGVPADYKTVPAETVRAMLRQAVAQRGSGAAAAVPGGTAGGVIGGIIGSVPVAAPGASTGVEKDPLTPRVERKAGAMELVRQVPPVYPPLAKQARVSGIVKLDAVIGKDGTMENLKVASGHPLLVPAALEAVKQWVYRPYVVNGEGVKVMTQIEVNFTLSDPAGDEANSEVVSRLVNRATKKCLTVRNAGVLRQAACGSGVGEVWKLRANGEIAGMASGRCLGSDGASLPSPLEQPCSGESGQRWQLRPSGEIVHRSSAQCLDIEDGSMEDNAAVALRVCSGADTQMWIVRRMPNPLSESTGKP